MARTWMLVLVALCATSFATADKLPLTAESIGEGEWSGNNPNVTRCDAAWCRAAGASR